MLLVFFPSIFKSFCEVIKDASFTNIRRLSRLFNFYRLSLIPNREREREREREDYFVKTQGSLRPNLIPITIFCVVHWAQSVSLEFFRCIFHPPKKSVIASFSSCVVLAMFSACSNMAKWQNSYCSGVWIVSALWVLKVFTVLNTSHFPTSAKRATFTSIVQKVPVRPIPALQCTIIGGPLGCPFHCDPNACTASFCASRTRPTICKHDSADDGTPKSGQEVIWKWTSLRFSPDYDMSKDVLILPTAIKN